MTFDRLYFLKRSAVRRQIEFGLFSLCSDDIDEVEQMFWIATWRRIRFSRKEFHIEFIPTRVRWAIAAYWKIKSLERRVLCSLDAPVFGDADFTLHDVISGPQKIEDCAAKKDKFFSTPEDCIYPSMVRKQIFSVIRASGDHGLRPSEICRLFLDRDIKFNLMVLSCYLNTQVRLGKLSRRKIKPVGSYYAIVRSLKSLESLEVLL